MSKEKKSDIFKRKKITEDQFLKALDIISKKLIYKFKFGYHEIEDMKQQASIFALEGLEKYDHKRPLENFLWTHVRNRLFNFKRDNYFRPESVCTTCPFYDPKCLKSNNQCSKFTNKNNCSLYNQWENRNNIKKNLMRPLNIDNESHNLKSSKDISDILSNKELIKLIEANIETKHRETYLKLKGGNKINKKDLVKLQEHIAHILQNNNITLNYE